MQKFVIGLTGAIGSGKDAAALFLTDAGYERRAFADALREEVGHAFDIHPQHMALLCSREHKERPDTAFEMTRCRDISFQRVMADAGLHGHRLASPRTIMRLWGTEYRRKQVPGYWINKLARFYDECEHPLVIPDVRFEDEAAWVRDNGLLIHIERVNNPYADEMSGHQSDSGVTFVEGDCKFFNDDSLSALGSGTLAVAVELERHFA